MLVSLSLRSCTLRFGHEGLPRPERLARRLLYMETSAEACPTGLNNGIFEDELEFDVPAPATSPPLDREYEVLVRRKQGERMSEIKRLHTDLDGVNVDLKAATAAVEP